MQRSSAQLWGKQGARAALIAGIAAVACLPASASAVSASPALAGAVSPVPVNGTPTLVATGTTEQIRQLVQCGGTMYAVGTFTEIKQGSTTYTRNNAFSFSATAPFAVTSWDPEVNGTVDTIAVNGTDSHRLPRRALLLGGRGHGQEHRRGRHGRRRAGARIQGQRQR